jgi:hypothetical protein
MQVLASPLDVMWLAAPSRSWAAAYPASNPTGSALVSGSGGIFEALRGSVDKAACDEALHRNSHIDQSATA